MRYSHRTVHITLDISIVILDLKARMYHDTNALFYMWMYNQVCCQEYNNYTLILMQYVVLLSFMAVGMVVV